MVSCVAYADFLERTIHGLKYILAIGALSQERTKLEPKGDFFCHLCTEIDTTDNIDIFETFFKDLETALRAFMV